MEGPARGGTRHTSSALRGEGPGWRNGVVVAFNDDSKGVQSSIAEIYVHAHLATPYNDFSTS